MDYKCRIDTIIRRAERIALPIGGLCAGAKVNKSTLYRWRQPNANPRLRTMRQALDAMEADLDRRERRIVSELSEGQSA